jgi:hypothetical protein
MKKAAWIIGIVAAVIVFLPVTLIVLIIALYDFNGARPWINETVSTALDRESAIEGDIGVGWLRRIEDLDYRLPRPRISNEGRCRTRYPLPPFGVLPLQRRGRLGACPARKAGRDRRVSNVECRLR